MEMRAKTNAFVRGALLYLFRRKLVNEFQPAPRVRAAAHTSSTDRTSFPPSAHSAVHSFRTARAQPGGSQRTPPSETASA